MLIQVNNNELKLPEVPTYENIREKATSYVGRNYPTLSDDIKAFMEKVWEVMIPMLLDYFPILCKTAREQNMSIIKQMQDYGIKGQYTDTYGWSKDRTMKFEFIVPADLRAFMITLVYRRFWEEDNKRVHRAFMNAICRGDDPMETLLKVKKMFGSTKDMIETV